MMARPTYPTPVSQLTDGDANSPVTAEQQLDERAARLATRDRAVRLAAAARKAMAVAHDAGDTEAAGHAARELGLWWAIADTYGATPADILAAGAAL
ncbi:hypothetical protein [Streptomyces sp. NPDC002599]|uniref:hypothetical protein n=1 Tax=Streptomyces sp. NPDC002599 TaxID=3154421 RepID=UPI0033278C02